METKIGTDIDQAAHLLKKGECVAVPTETVYGLAANGLDEAAIRKIFEAKERPMSNPLILHFRNEAAIEQFVLDFPAPLKKIAAQFWPGPLTILLPKSDQVPFVITAGNERVGVRVPSHPIFQKLLSQLEFPLAAPSANSYGQISPTRSEHVLKQLKGKIPYILEGGWCTSGVESTIVGMEAEKVVIYRLGAIPNEALEESLGYLPEIKNHTDALPVTSGMVAHHYAPNTPLSYCDSPEKTNGNSSNSGYIFFQNYSNSIPRENQFILSEKGDLREAAVKLYDALHTMDERKFDHLFVEKMIEKELGRTINDRLNRATKKK